MIKSKSYAIFRYSLVKTATVLVVITLLKACSSKLPGYDTDRKPMLEIYKEHIANTSTFNRELRHGTADLTAYTRTADNELEILFPLLPNPKIVLYIFPHIAEGVPVPGYSTSFSHYEKDHYALPAEHLK